MSYPPDASRSCHEADGRSDRSGGSGGGATSGSGGGGGVYGTLCSALGGGGSGGTTTGKWSTTTTNSTTVTTPSYTVNPDPLFCLSSSTNPTDNDRIMCNWKKWSLGLDYLLQDSEGVALFKAYLQYEGCANLLDFWFACQGFRSKVDPSDHRKITQLIKAIYRTYIRGAGGGSSSNSSGLNSQPLMYLGKQHPHPHQQQQRQQQQSTSLLHTRSEPIRLRSETRHAITERISRKHGLDQTVFDSAQAEVEHFLRTTAYPAFLKSDIYVDFLQTTLVEGGGGGCITRKFPAWWEEQSTSSTTASFYQFTTNVDKQLATIAAGGGLSDYQTNNLTLAGKVLPTLDEDRELQSEELLSSLSDPTRQLRRPCCCHMMSPGSGGDPVVMPPADHSHCQHCSKCHMYNPCMPMDCSQSGLRPPWCYQQSSPGGVPTSGSAAAAAAAAPLTMENLQMTRFYRTELSLQRPYLSSSSGTGSSSLHATKSSQEGEQPTGHTHVSRGCGSTTTPWRFHTRPNYVYTHWADAMCPPSMDPRLGNLPSQPPNPYHISYAPVSARDSEHHSLSSDARTDDTHSHTDSSHDGACNRLRALNHRYPSPFQLSRSHTNNNNNTATSNTNNNKHQSQLSLRHPQQYPHHHHHHHHHQHGPSASNPNEPTGLQCTSPKSSSYPIAFHQGLQQQQQQQQQLQHSNPFCRSPSGLGGSSGVTGGSHIQHYPTGNIPINPPTSGTANLLIPNITTTTPTTTTTATTTTNNNNLSSIQTSGEKTIQQSFDYNSNNNKLQQQQKHQRRLGRRGTSSRPFTSDKTKSYHTGSGGPGGVGVSSTGVGGVQQVNKSSKSNNRSYSMAEHDPKGFAQILTEKLQRLLENQLVTERLDSLMTETSPNVQESQEHTDEITGEVGERGVNETCTTHTTSTTSMTTSVPVCVSNTSSTTATNTTTTTTTTTTSTSSRVLGVGSSAPPSILQRPWADKLLAAARVQHENTRENAQAILEDHCSRIWAASADRTPSSGGGGGGGDGSGGGSGSGTGTGGGSGSAGGGGEMRPLQDPCTGNSSMNDNQSQRNLCLNNNNRNEHSFISSPLVVGIDEACECESCRHQQHQHPAYNRSCGGDGAASESWSHPSNVVENSGSFKKYLEDITIPQQTGQHKQQQHNSSEWTTTDQQQHTRSIMHHASVYVYSKSGSTGESSVTKSLPVVPPWYAAFPESSYTHKKSDIQSKHCVMEQVTDTTGVTGADDTTTTAITTTTTMTTATTPSTSTTTTNTSGTTGQLSTRTDNSPPTSSSHEHQRSAPTNTTSQSSTTHSSSATSAVSAGTTNSTPGSSSLLCSNSLVIGYYMGDDPVPYRSLWPSSEITLGQFKQLIPKKKGLFRYFFKKASDEFDSGVVHQEITNEDAILPLWEGKIVAKVERID